MGLDQYIYTVDEDGVEDLIVNEGLPMDNTYRKWYDLHNFFFNFWIGEGSDDEDKFNRVKIDIDEAVLESLEEWFREQDPEFDEPSAKDYYAEDDDTVSDAVYWRTHNKTVLDALKCALSLGHTAFYDSWA